jgi:hypothetical protein
MEQAKSKNQDLAIARIFIDLKTRSSKTWTYQGLTMLIRNGTG